MFQNELGQKTQAYNFGNTVLFLLFFSFYYWFWVFWLYPHLWNAIFKRKAFIIPSALSFKTRHCSIKLCQAITPSIFVHLCSFLHKKIDYDFNNHIHDRGMLNHREKNFLHDVAAWCKIRHVCTCWTLTFSIECYINSIFHFNIAFNVI